MPEGLLYDSGVAEVTLPDRITEIPSGCFYDCRNLRSIVLPPSVTKVANDAFHHCTALAEVFAAKTIVSIEMFDGEKKWQLNTSRRTYKYKVVVDGDVSYTDDYEEAVRGFGWSIGQARENLSTHSFSCEIFDNSTGELMHKDDYKL